MLGEDGKINTDKIRMIFYESFSNSYFKLGEKVVISGTGKLAPGMKVKVVEPTMNDDLDPNYQPPEKEK